MSIELLLIAGAFSTTALTWYLVVEDGPWEILRRFRWCLGVSLVLDRVSGTVTDIDEYAGFDEMDSLQMEYVSNGSVLSKIFSCTNCLTVYTSLIISLWVVWGMNLSWGEVFYYQPLVWGFLAATSLYINMYMRGK